MATYSYSGKLQTKCSDALEKAMRKAAQAQGMEPSEWLRQCVATAVIDQGIRLPVDCPENPAKDSPEGSANHVVDKLIAKALPRVREELGDYPYQEPAARFNALIAKLEELNDPKLWNYALEKFSDRTMTPMKRLHYVEEAVKFRG